ncbi:trace amine-associated receptor 4-like [Rhinatrema bivittatum]|uniref:trace amine-associated receptor 4-like n=1 Tax=Rhinatrema bivittatum TaxID=194408 RepID=UPI00112E3AA3|nr:trace amine-associated receptor 4-like [Rhinatrema bivittatum]
MNSPSTLSPQNTKYCFDFVNGSCPRTIRSLVSFSAMYMTMMGAIILTMGGNLVVVISIAHFKQLHSPTNFLILSLAAADFLVGLLVMPYSMVRSIDSCWYFGEWFCKLHTCCDIMLCTTSIFHLCFISVDRYYAVCQPLHYITKITNPVIAVFVLISWSVPCFLAVGKVLSDGIQDYVTSISCIGACSLTLNKLWGVLASLIAFFIPGTVMVGVYEHIFMVAKDQARKIHKVSAVSQSVSDTKKMSLKKESKAAKTLSVVMGVFILCWLPFFIATMADPFINFSTPEDLFNAFLWLGYFNSAFNPIIYGLFYPSFHKAFKSILTGKIFSSDSSIMNLYSNR